jgi:thioredoxin-related protein
MCLMKRFLLLLLCVASISPSIAGDKDKQVPGPVSKPKINWMTTDEVQVAMNKQPRKIYFDMYTDWCGWCKVMDSATFTSPEVIEYFNKNFYAVKFNAERRDSLRFVGQMWGFVPEYKAHMLAIQLMRGQMSYPTSVILDEQFQNPMAFPGFLNVANMERFLKFTNENHYKTVPFDTFNVRFTPVWKPGPRG